MGSLRVLDEITTAPGSAQRLQPGGEVRRLADTACSSAAPVPMWSPTTTSQVAMPTRTCKGHWRWS
jgi:hypothetical protein